MQSIWIFWLVPWLLDEQRQILIALSKQAIENVSDSFAHGLSFTTSLSADCGYSNI